MFTFFLIYKQFFYFVLKIWKEKDKNNKQYESVVESQYTWPKQKKNKDIEDKNIHIGQIATVTI